MFDHTPGPWWPVRNNHYWEIRSRAHGQIGDTCASETLYNENGIEIESAGIPEANARLMAAAPTMLEALRSAESALEEMCVGQDPANTCWEILAEVRNAIDDARE